MSKRCKGIIYAIKSICFDKLQRHIWFGLESHKQDREVTAEERYKARVTRESKNVMITEIDSCEYLTFYTYGGALVFTHKGNCKYCRAWIKRTCN